MEDTRKRKAGDDSGARSDKRRKKQWRVPRSNDSAPPPSILPGDTGIWATCDRGREGKCVGELKDLFNEYAEILYPEATAEGGNDEAAEDHDIENDIQAEINDLHHPKTRPLFTQIRTDVQCVVFLRTEAPVDPVALVKRICQDAMESPARKRTRFVKRLSPMTLLGRASEEGLEKVAKEVLAPYFHQEPHVARKFAIRPNIRNHTILSRDSVIKQVAKIVGPNHQVNLKEYDLLIIVEVYKNICGVSVLDASFDALKRYNLAEIFQAGVKQDEADATD